MSMTSTVIPFIKLTYSLPIHNQMTILEEEKKSITGSEKKLRTAPHQTHLGTLRSYLATTVPGFHGCAFGRYQGAPCVRVLIGLTGPGGIGEGGKEKVVTQVKQAMRTVGIRWPVVVRFISPYSRESLKVLKGGVEEGGGGRSE